LRFILALQIAMMSLCAVGVTQLIVHFPFPSPLIRPLLAPKQAWPSEQISRWVESGDFDSGYLEYFARDPERRVPKGANLVSPADGIVQRIHSYEGITYLVVGLSFWDVHVVRTPVAGVVKDIQDDGSFYPRGPFLGNDGLLRGKPFPVQKIVTLDTEYGEAKVRLITSYWASRLKVWAQIGERIEKGDKIGRILLGSTVIVELPGDFPLTVKTGQRVVGGETVISGQGGMP